jgi:tRNA threonylcarbamoyladenosine biosynthesis protein TsaE
MEAGCVSIWLVMQRTFHKTETDTIAKELLASLTVGESATVVALAGDLGAGKTTLSQAIARALGITENVVSPTFVIMKLYKVATGPYKQLVHIDAYRLQSASEIERLGWAELVADPKNLILIEWPEKVPEALPPNTHRVTLTHISEEERGIAW